MSLDKIGKMLNLNVSKLCFPYDIATSVCILKQLTSLHPHDEHFWKNSFNKNPISLENRLQAQQLYEKHNFKNLYDYGTFYLTQDCLLLHEILLTLFNSYLENSINLFTRRNYSQSSLSYQQFFIVYPSQQIDKLLAPRQMHNPLYNYIIKCAITGGLTTSFVHGSVGKSFPVPINDHLNYVNPTTNYDSHIWPNLTSLQPNCFKEQASGIATVDIRSLYPSATCKKLPVGKPLLFSRFTNQNYNLDLHPSPLINLNTFCQQAQTHGNTNTDLFKLISKKPGLNQEFQVLCYYLQTLPQNITIIRFQSIFTALGQLFLDIYPVDGFLTYKDKNNNIFIKIIQYHSSFFHGHREHCTHYNTLDIDKIQNTTHVRTQIKIIIDSIKKLYTKEHSPVNIEYIEIYDCDFVKHKIPHCQDYLPNIKTQYTYNHFLEHISQKNITGFLVIKNLELKKTAQNPLFGFLVQKVEYGHEQLSPYSQSQIKKLATGKRVISMHASKSFIVISTEYFCWLKNTFGFQSTPNILHALIFKTDHYLKTSLEAKLTERKHLKELIKLETNNEIKTNLEVKAELIKLMLNSCYGYTLCNLTSSKFKLFENRRQPPRKHLRANRLTMFHCRNLKKKL